MLNKAVLNGGVNTKSNIFIKNEVLPSGGQPRLIAARTNELRAVSGVIYDDVAEQVY